jgi:histidyl-tRNA synthetase
VIQKPKGTRDFFKQEASLRFELTSSFIEFAQKIGFTALEVPTFEDSQLFKRSAGTTSDIAQKELFYLASQKERGYALRPELTAGVVRALIEKGLKSMPKPVNVYTVGSVYRYEKPQKGRYREFTQFDLNSFQNKNPLFDAFLITATYRFLKDSVKSDLIVYINSLGSNQTKEKYAQKLLETFKKNKDLLCNDCQQRITKNPLRVLDCKAGCKDRVQNIPAITDYLTEEEKKYFKEVTDFLNKNDIEYKIDPMLIRGLDYYTSIIFEVALKSDASRASVVCGGGRFDGLVEKLGGPTIEAIGLGIGLDRVVDSTKIEKEEVEKDFLVSPLSLQYSALSYEIALNLLLNGRSIEVANNYGLQENIGYALKNNFKNIIIVGEETKKGSVVIKDLKKNKQDLVKISSL